MKLLPQGLWHNHAGRFLDHLLIAALHRTIAFTEVNHLAAPIAHKLHFDMARLRHETFHEQGSVVERGLRFGTGGLEARLAFGGFAHDDHTAPTAARRRLEQHGIAE